MRSLKFKESLEAIVPGIELVVIDLMDATDEAWKQAVQGCQFGCHVASPFPIVAPANEDDLIKPAVEGTKKVLRAFHAAGIKRASLTSSCASVSSGMRDQDRTFTGEDWSVLEKCETYPKSKTLAERAAWEFAKESGLELATINPVYICGPILLVNIHLHTCNFICVCTCI